MKWIFPLALLVIFEMVADVLAKQWSLDRKMFLAIAALTAYLIANTFWLFALKGGSGLARGAAIFSISTEIFAIILGVLIYKEGVTKVQLLGLILGVVSLTLLLWHD